MENVEISIIKLYSYMMPYLPYGNVYKKGVVKGRIALVKRMHVRFRKTKT